MDDTDGSTILHIACEMLSDFQIVELIVNAGADLNPVRNDDKLPLTIIRERLEADPDNNDLYDIEEFLTRMGGKVSWRDWKKKVTKRKRKNSKKGLWKTSIK